MSVKILGSVRSILFPNTQVQLSQCGGTPATGSTLVYATPTATATVSQWRFRLINVSLSYNQVIPRAFASFWLNFFTGLVTSTTYTVEVAVNIGGTLGPYGTICNINTPGVLPLVADGNPTASASKEVSLFDIIAYPNPFQNNF